MTYYQILRISNTATLDEIASAFRNLAKKYHPDINKSADAQSMFINIFEAYEILRDIDKRRIYDEQITNDKIDFERMQRYEKYKYSARSTAEKYSKKTYSDFYEEIIRKGIVLGEKVAKASLRAGIKITIQIIIYGLLLLISIGIIKCSAISISSKMSQKREFEKEEIVDLVDNMGRYTEKYQYGPDSEYDLKGKRIIIVDIKKKDMSSIYYELPIKSRARQDNEIDFLIQLDRISNVVGKYQDGLPAIKVEYEIRIVDYRIRKEVEILRIMGSDPPDQNGGIMGSSGSDPINVILQEILKKI